VPNSSRDVRKFQRAAAQRIAAAEMLVEHGFHLESIYLAGYAVECSLKALILRRTPRRVYRAMYEQLTHGRKGHDIESLRSVLRASPIHCELPAKIRELLNRVATWNTDLRYEVGLVAYRDAARFLDAARQIREWAERSQ
jgi:HEPN domain-containing protein